MKLKKFNAVVAILSAITLFIHMGYMTYSCLTMYYNPNLNSIFSIPFFICVAVHGVCGMCSVFLLGDGTRLDIYKKQNRKTVIQRVSAAFIFPLLIVHLKTFELLQEISAEGKWLGFVVVIIIQILFFVEVTVHTALSLSKAFITLGILQDRNKQKMMDRIVAAICVIMFLIAAFAVVKWQLSMFLPK